ncbi:ABC transporter permease [Dongia sp.]|uniref:ABC transporter permease n=1 Tax=Dongia sp. TaxID=1977262 RepID=UPI0035B2E66E
MFFWPKFRARLAQFHTTLVMIFLLAPLAIMVPISLTSGTMLTLPVPGWSLHWYEVVFTDPRWTGALVNSLIIGVASTAIATALGTLAAMGLTWGRFPGQRSILAVISLPLVLPIIILGVACFSFYAALGLIGSRLSLILAHAGLAAPVVVTTVMASLKGFDRTLMRAGASLGAGPWLSFRRILVPLVAPGIMTGALVAFLISFDEVVIASFISSADQRTLPRQIFSGVRESISPAIAAAAIVLVVISGLLLALTSAVQRRAKLHKAAPK